jgi:hypothetical protein
MPIIFFFGPGFPVYKLLILLLMPCTVGSVSRGFWSAICGDGRWKEITEGHKG